MKRKDSKLFAETRSVEKIIVRTSWPCEVPNPVCRMTARHLPSGAPTRKWQVRQHPKDTANRLTSATCLQHLRSAEQDRTIGCAVYVELFIGLPQLNGLLQQRVDSPLSMASLTIQVPHNNSKSPGIDVSVWAWTVPNSRH